MSDEEARATFAKIRWADNGGNAYCPRCGCLKVYTLGSQPGWKCSACKYKFSVTAGTIFADRKRPVRDYLLAIAIFANGAKGHSALQLPRDLNCQYRTAFVMAGKLREAIDAEQRDVQLSGTVEVDGAYFAPHQQGKQGRGSRQERATGSQGRGGDARAQRLH
jgi:transposase-like protein